MKYPDPEYFFVVHANYDPGWKTKLPTPEQAILTAQISHRKKNSIKTYLTYKMTSK